MRSVGPGAVGLALLVYERGAEITFYTNVLETDK